MAMRRKVTESYEAGQKRKAEERRRRGFTYRTRPGAYGDSPASRLGRGAAGEQSGKDRFSKGSFGGKKKKR